jgi:hypothetical protein
MTGNIYGSVIKYIVNRAVVKSSNDGLYGQIKTQKIGKKP